MLSSSTSCGGLMMWMQTQSVSTRSGKNTLGPHKDSWAACNLTQVLHEPLDTSAYFCSQSERCASVRQRGGADSSQWLCPGMPWLISALIADGQLCRSAPQDCSARVDKHCIGVNLPCYSVSPASASSKLAACTPCIHTSRMHVAHAHISRAGIGFSAGIC